MPKPKTLTNATLSRALSELAGREAAFARILAEFGPPPMWAREPGFGSLLRIILEQQVSLASARAAFDKLLGIAAPLTPERFLELDDATLKAVGFSRQKTAYGRYLARALTRGGLDLKRLAAFDDAAVREELLRVKGIGPWTADIYLLMVLRRPDIWPAGDRALTVSAQRVLGLRSLPTQAKLDSIATAWRPWRAVAARLLWHHYLSTGRR